MTLSAQPGLGSHHRSKRRRVMNACSECYRRKQKVSNISSRVPPSMCLTFQCDRQQPCSNCLARNVSAKCTFNNLSLYAGRSLYRASIKI